MMARSLDTLKRWSVGTLIAVSLLLFPSPVFAANLKDIISGYYKILTTFSRATATEEGIYLALQRLRLEFRPKLTKNIELNLTYDHELLLNDFSNTSDFSLIRQKNQKNLAFLDADKAITDRDSVFEKHLLFRGYLKFESPHSRWTLGKQLIDWGRMRFYSPLDLFNQPLPSDIEAEERVGFDAFNIELSSDDFSGINLLYGPGSNESETSYGLRLYKKFKTYDTFFIAAKHTEDKVLGFGFDGYVYDAGLRGEFTYTKDGKETYPRASIGVDYNFPHQIYCALEYFYNGAANGDFTAFSTSLVEQRKRLSLEKHLLSLMVTHEFTPLLKFRCLSIYDFDGKSAFLNPELRYNVAKDVDVAAGTQIFLETPGSEFEDSNNIYYISLKYFF